jgi:hypothetical protein
VAGLIGDNKEEVGGAEQKKPDTKINARTRLNCQNTTVYMPRDVDKPYKKEAQL